MNSIILLPNGRGLAAGRLGLDPILAHLGGPAIITFSLASWVSLSWPTGQGVSELLGGLV